MECMEKATKINKAAITTLSRMGINRCMEGFGSTIGIRVYIMTVLGVILQGGRLSESFRITASAIDFLG